MFKQYNRLINFPIDDPRWKNTGEDGLIVKLVVCHNNYDYYNNAYVTDTCHLSLIGDDRRPMPLMMASDRRTWEEFHYPNINNEKSKYQFLSRPYLATIMLGATTWTGWSETEMRYWTCTYEDLSSEGRTLYHQIQALFPECDLHLLTFLDT